MVAGLGWHLIEAGLTSELDADASPRSERRESAQYGQPREVAARNPGRDG
jgi:hypothetical protein